MSDYKRFVSYLYCYDNGIKKNNIGYARVETRNGQCKITIHIKLLSLSNTTLEAYLFYRKDNQIIGLPLCPLEVKNSIGDCQLVIPANSISNSGLPFSMMGGIIIAVSPSRLLGTEWDDHPIIPSIFKIEDTKTIQAADIEPEAETVAEATVMLEAAVSPEAAITAEAAVKTEAVAEPEAAVELEAATEPDAAVKADAVAEPDAATEADADMKPEITDQSVNTPDFINTITNYLLIDPAYIDHLDVDYAGLRQNSFLLHGYDSYRHLILAKWLVSSQLSAAESADPEVTDFDIFYQLGVPGIYSAREKAIAEKFGFCEFKTTKGTPVKYGDFGYWLVPVTF